ncbi:MULTISPECIES: PRC-barrel domain-containing protein [unclassified Curtobacterium]|uniref:PRC-barrel domain-containing protein n=1 Tax=unclassified Curtobacterium TaxID=257496 RepID=UPI0008DE1F44|nr:MULTISPECIES: PRC-barrel domain-containing protein [unclassified Curtobacterium]OIH98593.1 photosystem reaction center subunit H [Curtobacterium sp. MCBA15_003]OII14999.1 photosystem reaction center subunit H [Curtobacterium sp. MCBA15_009]OII32318.1 photosystem reaction center subunit H [Curtobacterium sp. MMLR14_006]WIE63368.1 PRC-barrel domain-containing protein [Curtobacterium sp. MCLR17_036]
MFEAADIRDWIGLPVVDEADDKVGTLESIYYDTATSEASFGALTTGMVGFQKLLFVPLVGATVTPKHLRVTFPKKLVKDAPSIPTDGQLEAETEPVLYQHYGLEYRTGSGGERRLGRR